MTAYKKPIRDIPDIDELIFQGEIWRESEK